MLDQTTKRKIDSARNILVGKVPDPKAQVEQITTALIYKFMDDMDKESEELGGKADFFTNGFEKYSWTKLMDKRLSGPERLDLYVQAISNMSKNPHIPQLFRDIFKDAFLPYRDFETLSLFLKEIDGFNYEHSENLGDAFEYLLAVLGSQGNAGQFRTPRHIIDFIVEVVDPKKNENILDPACGTAGFLISAYKHIIKHNSSNFKPAKEKVEEKIRVGKTAAETVLEEKTGYTGDKLSPDEKTKVMKNIAGYDISPDMVKLSLVNLYLHGFTNPVVHEYDTLTSEKRWNESFDVIMANPPFMTPKGGIRPHKRFQVQANRSEVLFVDYILEHLNPNGRAGIIVPEGIIFQSNNAYKQLRKLLLEDGLFAVVSLPPGVFNPYSGVKTSVLFFDNQRAKKTDEILFVKVQNDGFDLGAQRRKIDKNDLSEALAILEAWKKGEKQVSEIAAWASKEKIAESGDHNLTGDRYRTVAVIGNQKWQLVELKNICKYFRGVTYSKKDEVVENGHQILRANNIALQTNNFDFSEIKQISRTVKLKDNQKLGKYDILICAASGSKAHLGKVAFAERDYEYYSGGFMGVIRAEEEILPKFLYYSLADKRFKKFVSDTTAGANIQNLKFSTIGEYKIPLPPIEIQKEIVEQIEVKQNAIEHAREVIKSLERERRYFGQSLRKLEDVEWIELGEVAELIGGFAFKSGKLKKEKEDNYLPVIKIGNLKKDGCLDLRNVEYHEFNKELKKYMIQKGDVLIAMTGATVGKVSVANLENLLLNQRVGLVRPKDENIIKEYIQKILLSDLFYKYCQNTAGGGAQGNIAPKQILKYKIPRPSLEIQKHLIAEAKNEDDIIAANQKLINIMEEKINDVLSEI